MSKDVRLLLLVSAVCFAGMVMVMAFQVMGGFTDYSSLMTRNVVSQTTQ